GAPHVTIRRCARDIMPPFAGPPRLAAAAKEPLAEAGRMTRDDLTAAIARYTWWHSIDLGDGVTTTGVKTAELMAIELANTFSNVDLRGKSVLDIGASDGGFSVEAARRGASRVVALDQYERTYEYWRGRETLDLVC